MRLTANIIHMPARADRMENIVKQSTEQGFEYVLWPAQKPVEREKTCAAISRAHKQIVRHAKDTKLREVLIMEDDVRFTAPGAFDYFMEQLEGRYVKDFGLYHIYLGGIMTGRPLESMVRDFSGLHCYVVHEDFYDTFLGADENQHLDRWLACTKGAFHICHPMVAFQTDGYSDNSSSMEFFAGRIRKYPKFGSDNK